MLSILEVDRKRKTARTLPPGFRANPCPSDTNNSSTLRESLKYPSRVTYTACQDAKDTLDDIIPQNVTDRTSTLQNIDRTPQTIPGRTPRNTTEINPQHITRSADPGSHMMPVTNVALKRSKLKSQPPGFRSSVQSNDVNNNSKEKGKLNILSGVFMAMLKVKSDVDEKKIAQERKARQDKYKAKASTSGENKEEAPSTSKWKHGFGLKDKLYPMLPSSLKDKDSRVWTLSEEREVAGEPVLVNKHDEFGGTDVTDWEYSLDERLTPENYGQSCVFYDHRADNRREMLKTIYVLGDIAFKNEIRNIFLTENYGQSCVFYDHGADNRREMLKTIYVLGDMLAMNELEGDREAWVEYTEKALREEQAWRERRKESDEYFKKEGRRILGHSEPLCKRALRLLRDVTTKAGDCFIEVCPCPCFFRDSG